jgi:hypothetical protein
MFLSSFLSSRGIKNPIDLWLYIKRHVLRLTVQRGTDPELRQLRSLQRAYAKKDGPEVIIFGDSAMFWTTPHDATRKSLSDMIRDGLGRDVEVITLAGSGYNALLISAFLTVLENSRSRPKAIVVPTSVLMAQTLWAESPLWSYIPESAAMREMTERGGEVPLKGLPRATEKEWEDYDRLPAPSLFGARRTVGEIRLIINSVPTSPWQTAVRLRHLMDFYNAQELQADSPGVALVGHLGAHIAKLAIPTVAYIAPVNYEVLRTMFGETSLAHLRRNADLVESAFAETSGEHGHVVNAVFDNPSTDFIDPVHLTRSGREHLARRISDIVRPLLSAGAPSAEDQP